MTLEEIEKRIVETLAQRDAFVTQANVQVGRFMGQIEMLEEMKLRLLQIPSAVGGAIA
jgi:hypothetical protein